MWCGGGPLTSHRHQGFLTGPVHLAGPCQKLLMAGRRIGSLPHFCDSDILNIVHAEARRVFKECRMLF